MSGYVPFHEIIYNGCYLGVIEFDVFLIFLFPGNGGNHVMRRPSESGLKGSHGILTNKHIIHEKFQPHKLELSETLSSWAQAKEQLPGSGYSSRAQVNPSGGSDSLFPATHASNRLFKTWLLDQRLRNKNSHTFIPTLSRFSKIQKYLNKKQHIIPRDLMKEKQMDFLPSRWLETSSGGEVFNPGTLIGIHDEALPKGQAIHAPWNSFHGDLVSRYQHSLWKNDGSELSLRLIRLNITGAYDQRRQVARSQIIGPWNSFDTWLDDLTSHFKRDTILNVVKVAGIILLHYLAPGVLTWIDNTFGTD